MYSTRYINVAISMACDMKDNSLLLNISLSFSFPVLCKILPFSCLNFTNVFKSDRIRVRVRVGLGLGKGFELGVGLGSEVG